MTLMSRASVARGAGPEDLARAPAGAAAGRCGEGHGRARLHSGEVAIRAPKNVIIPGPSNIFYMKFRGSQ
jgi:hypothetical protein